MNRRQFRINAVIVVALITALDQLQHTSLADRLRVFDSQRKDKAPAEQGYIRPTLNVDEAKTVRDTLACLTSAELTDKGMKISDGLMKNLTQFAEPVTAPTPEQVAQKEKMTQQAIQRLPQVAVSITVPADFGARIGASQGASAPAPA